LAAAAVAAVLGAADADVLGATGTCVQPAMAIQATPAAAIVLTLIANWCPTAPRILPVHDYPPNLQAAYLYDPIIEESPSESDAAEHLKGRRRALEPIVDAGIIRVGIGWNPRCVDSRRIAQDAPGRIFAIQEIADRSEDLEVREGPVIGVQVDSRISWQRWQLIGLIPDVIGAADDVQRSSH
jgi:hypothetical protein